MRLRSPLSVCLPLFVGAIILLTSQQAFSRHTTHKGVLKKVTEHVYLYERKTFSNTGIILTDKYAVLIDAGGEPLAPFDVLRELRQVTHLPLRYVVNTHFHDDHTLGNEYFLPFVDVIAHKEADADLFKTKEDLLKFRATVSPGLDISEAEIIHHTITFDGNMTLGNGEDRVELLYFGPARTKGDTFVYVPRDKVLFTGDAYTLQIQPTFDHPDYESWASVLRQILKVDADKLIGGHGGVQAKESVEKWLEYYADLKAAVEEYIRAGKSVDVAKREIKLEKYKNWRGYDTKGWLQINIQNVYEQLTGKRKQFYTVN